MTERFFSPSQCHMDVMSRTEREFAWTGQEFGPWQAALRARLRELLGDRPPERVPLDVEEIDREETDDYVRMRIVFAAEECADVPAHLLVPRHGEGPFPAMVCLQGHSPGMHISIGEAHNEQERESIAGDRDFAIQAVRHGFVAVALEQRCFGERSEQVQQRRMPHGCQDAVMHALMLGRTVIGERVWDVMRSIDLLQEQPEVDRNRIACMGNSGGGTVTFYAACMDERIKLAVPSCSFCTYADSIMRIEHCADNYIPGILKVAETGELAGLIAPRRLLIVAGEQDDIVPIGGVREAYATAQSVFAAAGCQENIRLVVGPGGHRFYAAEAWPVIAQMMR
jgi:dienelactone hydrolase